MSPRHTNYILEVINSKTLSTLEISANDYSVISIGNLTENTFYLVNILSKNMYEVRTFQFGYTCKVKIRLHIRSLVV